MVWSHRAAYFPRSSWKQVTASSIIQNQTHKTFWELLKFNRDVAMISVWGHSDSLVIGIVISTYEGVQGSPRAHKPPTVSISRSCTARLFVKAVFVIAHVSCSFFKDCFLGVGKCLPLTNGDALHVELATHRYTQKSIQIHKQNSLLSLLSNQNASSASIFQTG